MLAICDYMTKFVQAVALPAKEAPAVVAALYKMTESNVALATSSHRKKKRKGKELETPARPLLLLIPFHPR